MDTKLPVIRRRLIAGKQCRLDEEFLTGEWSDSQSWRIFVIISELVAGFNLLRKYNLAATFFGTSRENVDITLAAEAEDLAGRLAKDGYAIITGGGNGVMEHANKGAKEAGGPSVGLNIALTEMQGLNEYVTDSANFNHFFVRKVMLAFASEVYVFFPGGFGTMDEFFELVTLIQTKKIKPIPIILLGKDFWIPLLSWIEEMLYKKYGAIDEKDMAIYTLVDSVDEAYALITKQVTDKVCVPE